MHQTDDWTQLKNFSTFTSSPLEGLRGRNSTASSWRFRFYLSSNLHSLHPILSMTTQGGEDRQQSDQMYAGSENCRVGGCCDAARAQGQSRPSKRFLRLA